MPGAYKYKDETVINACKEALDLPRSFWTFLKTVKDYFTQKYNETSCSRSQVMGGNY